MNNYAYLEVLRSLADMFPKISEEARDLLSKLLMFNPDKRITAEVSSFFVLPQQGIGQILIDTL